MLPKASQGKLLDNFVSTKRRGGRKLADFHRGHLSLTESSLWCKGEDLEDMGNFEFDSIPHCR